MASLSGYPVIIRHENGDWACVGRVPLESTVEYLYVRVVLQGTDCCALYPPLSKVQRVYFIRMVSPLNGEQRPLYYPMSHAQICYPTADIRPIMEWLEQGRLPCGCIGVSTCTVHPPYVGTVQ